LPKPIQNLILGNRFSIVRQTSAPLRRGVGGDVLIHKHPPLILLLKEDDHLSFIKNLIPKFIYNIDTSNLNSGKQINLTRITSAPLRRGVGGDVMKN
jgi:hypothetical protein